ncbi:MAG TPA: urease accessory protein UreF [Nostocaceae cyanobacterium]|nr:urease accessory protein UreF [Nostocaceae cyanobacterium]
MDNIITLTDYSFLSILQLASPALPVGAYSYSEGLETLVENGTITNQKNLQKWIEGELLYGAIRIDGAVMARSHLAATTQNIASLRDWNQWLSATRDTEELRGASWQMGRSLLQLLGKLKPETSSLIQAVGYPCNYAVAFGIAAAHWQIKEQSALLAYLHSWVSNLITAGIKLIPLGQTTGQELLLMIQPLLITATAEIFTLEDDQLAGWTWGLSLASMQHEIQYTRLFRS